MHNIYRRDLNNVDIENFLLDILCSRLVLKVVVVYVNLSFNQLYNTVNQIIDKYICR